MTRTANQVENKIFHIKKKWRETNLFVTSETGKVIRKGNNETTWRGVLIQNFQYYYDLEDVYNNRAAYHTKATSNCITVTGYAPSVAVALSETNAND